MTPEDVGAGSAGAVSATCCDLGSDEPLVAAEAAAWREWRDAEDRVHGLARLHRQAANAARLAQGTWHKVATELGRRHPGDNEFSGTTGEPSPGPASGPPAEDPTTRSFETTARAMISCLRARLESTTRPVVPDEVDLGEVADRAAGIYATAHGVGGVDDGCPVCVLSGCDVPALVAALREASGATRFDAHLTPR